jgi:hypothetical protein
MFKNSYKYTSTTFNNKAQDVISSNKFRWFQRLVSLKTSESETGVKIKFQKMMKGWGRQQAKDCCTLTANALKIRQQGSIKCYHKPQAG